MDKNIVKTRFAPSPTGFLHIGGARTALFNWLFAKKEKGQFLLRIEDTDLVRSNSTSSKSIINGLKWLNLNWDGEIVSQKSRRKRHLEVANKLLEKNLAYKCYSKKDEIEVFKKNQGNNRFFKSPWRNKISEINESEPYVIRLKTPENGKIDIFDKAKGKISWSFNEIEDLILVRSDGTPTYNLAVVVDDYDYQISHVIRGDDHLTNTVKQCTIYKSLEWNIPIFCHLPLIHSHEGKKLSKRDGNFGLVDFINEGYDPSAVINYLLRLGWSYSNKEFFTLKEAIDLFNLDSIGKSPARIDDKKLKNVSKFHLKDKDEKYLLNELKSYSKNHLLKKIDDVDIENLKKAIPYFKGKFSSYKEILNNCNFFLKKDPIKLSNKEKIILDTHNLKLVHMFTIEVSSISWDIDNLGNCLKNFVSRENIKFVEIAQPLRIILTGVSNSPSIDFVMSILGKNETLKRLKKFQNL